MTHLIASHHAHSRQAQRNLSDDDIDFVYVYGYKVYARGALHIVLRGRDIPRDKDSMRRFGRLEGTTLVLQPTSDRQWILVTVYRNRHALKHLKVHSH